MILSAENLSKYRQQLFGIGIIGVMLVHSTFQIKYPQPVSKIFAFGGIGVYIFVFLSGIGLYFSLRKANDCINKKKFYKKRMCRVLIPYFLIAGFWYGVKYLPQYQLFDFFYELSTISFWLDHQGAWYVAMLIPLYAIYPFYYDWVENANRIQRVLLSISISLLLSIVNPVAKTPQINGQNFPI